MLQFQNFEKIVEFEFLFFFFESPISIILFKHFSLEVSGIKSAIHLPLFEKSEIPGEVFFYEKAEAMSFIILPLD